MIITLLAGGFGGAFFHYAMLMGIQNGTLSRSVRLWLQCVVVPALMFALCSATIAQYFFDEFSYLLMLAMWVVFTVAMHPAYVLTDYREEDKQQ